MLRNAKRAGTAVEHADILRAGQSGLRLSTAQARGVVLDAMMGIAGGGGITAGVLFASQNVTKDKRAFGGAEGLMITRARALGVVKRMRWTRAIVDALLRKPGEMTFDRQGAPGGRLLFQRAEVRRAGRLPLKSQVVVEPGVGRIGCGARGKSMERRYRHHASRRQGDAGLFAAYLRKLRQPLPICFFPHAEFRSFAAARMMTSVCLGRLKVVGATLHRVQALETGAGFSVSTATGSSDVGSLQALILSFRLGFGRTATGGLSQTVRRVPTRQVQQIILSCLKNLSCSVFIGWAGSAPLGAGMKLLLVTEFSSFFRTSRIARVSAERWRLAYSSKNQRPREVSRTAASRLSKLSFR